MINIGKPALPPRRRKGQHVVFSDAATMKCLHCGVVQKIAMPCEVPVYVAAARAFERSHRHCLSEAERHRAHVNGRDA